MGNVDELESFIDETIHRAIAKHYTPTIFRQMRSRWGTVEAMRRLVISGNIQSGLTRLVDLDLVDYSIEAAVLKFPSYFGTDVIASAEWRLKQLAVRTAVNAPVVSRNYHVCAKQ